MKHPTKQSSAASLRRERQRSRPRSRAPRILPAIRRLDLSSPPRKRGPSANFRYLPRNERTPVASRETPSTSTSHVAPRRRIVDVDLETTPTSTSTLPRDDGSLTSP